MAVNLSQENGHLSKCMKHAVLLNVRLAGRLISLHKSKFGNSSAMTTLCLSKIFLNDSKHPNRKYLI